MDIELFEGEEKAFTNIQDGQPLCLSDEEIDIKYAKGEVRIVTEQARYQVNTILSMLKSGGYELNPEFQRRHRWDLEKKSRLIESFIMNVPIPPIFLYEDEYSHYEVMDGLQRLTAVREFYENKYVLKGLQEWPELNGKKYEDLPDQVKRGIDRRYLSSIILLQETAKTDEEAQRLKQLVFERINSGGMKLEPQEARNAIYNGPLNELCIRLARNESLCKLWRIPLSQADSDEPSEDLLNNETYRKMDDVELVLRFFAYRQRVEYQRGSLKEYLDLFLRNGNLFEQPVFESYESLFEATVSLVWDVMGEGAFSLWRKRQTGWSWYDRPTTVVYDPMMAVFSQLLDHSEKLVDRKDTIREGLPAFYEKNYAMFEGRNTNRSNLVGRGNLFHNYLTKMIA